MIDCGGKTGEEEEESGATISIGAVMIHLVLLPLLAVAPPSVVPPSPSPSIRLRPYVGSAASMLPSSRISGDFGCQVDR